MANLDINLQDLNVISAGAGSGKTYTVQQTLSSWLKDHPKDIKPDRILAVTFTNMAASEMQYRIRSALLTNGNMEAAKEVTSSQISTIHSFGQKIIQTFAYEEGMSPKVRQLSEAEEKILLQLSLSSHREINEILEKLESLGYKGKYNGSEYSTALDQLQGRVLGLINSLRTIGATEDKTVQYITKLATEIRALYGVTDDASILNINLHESVKVLLSSFPNSMKNEFGGNATADEKYTSNYRALTRGIELSTIETDFGLWKSLQSLRIPKFSTVKTKDIRNAMSDAEKITIKESIEDYASLAIDVIDAANKLSVHPGPLEEAILHISTLLQISVDTLQSYNEAKRENALIDFSDMVHISNSIMDNDEWITEMSNTYDCLVIDEFQDTNPIQFALLWKFKQAGLKTLIVGDLKQSIMGFQGADASLFESLIDDKTASIHQLENNWRSTPDLMKFINAMGKNLYGSKYTSLSPKSSYPSTLTPMKILDFNDNDWSANGSPGKGKKSFSREQTDVISAHIKEMVDSKVLIFDKNTKVQRPIQPSDIAILGHSHTALGRAASSLRSCGLEAQIKQAGWFNSRIIQIAYHALSYLANPLDNHAALYMIITELGDMSLQEALTMYIENDKKLNHPLIEKIDEIREHTQTLTIARQLIFMIEELELWNYVLEHVDSSQQRANLLKLIDLCTEFESLQFESLNALGIYGRNINSFLSWLSMNESDSQPKAKSINTQAVQLLTWYASKGLEWPVVIVMGLDTNKKPKTPNISLGYTDESRNDPLKNTYVKFFTQFQDDTTNKKFVQNLEAAAHSTIENLLYVAMTRAREQLILPWPSFKEGSAGEFSFMNKLTTLCELEVDSSAIEMKELDDDFEVSIIPAISSNEDILASETSAINYGRVAIETMEQVDQVSSQISPSTITEEGNIDADTINIIKYGPLVNLSGLDMPADSLGTFLHHCYHVLLTNREIKDRLFSSLSSKLSDDVLKQVDIQISEFEKYSLDAFKMIKLECEVPILNITPDGGVVSGSIDLLIETEEGYWIIDHKSDKVEENSFSEQFIHHYPQLMSYVKHTKLGKPIIGVGINWIRYGMLSLVNVSSIND